MEYMFTAVPAVVFALFMVAMLVGKTGSHAKKTATGGKPAATAEKTDQPATDTPARPTSPPTNWRWVRATRDRLFVRLERVDQPGSPAEPRPAAPSRPVLVAVPDPAPAPEGLDPMTIVNRAYRLARQRRSATQAQAKAKEIQQATAEHSAQVIQMRGQVTADAGASTSSNEPVLVIGAPAAGQMNGLVEAIAQAAALLARIPTQGDIRNPVAQIAAFARAQAALALSVTALRQRMAEARHDPLVLALAESAESITRTAATALAETALTAAMRYRGMAADKAAGTQHPNVHHS